MGPVRALRIHQKSAPSSSALYIQGTEKGQGKRWDCRKSWKSPNRFASCLSDQKLLNSQAKLLWSISIPIEMQAETKWSQGENHFTLLDHFHGSRWRCSNFFFFLPGKSQSVRLSGILIFHLPLRGRSWCSGSPAWMVLAGADLSTRSRHCSSSPARIESGRSSPASTPIWHRLKKSAFPDSPTTGISRPQWGAKLSAQNLQQLSRCVWLSALLPLSLVSAGLNEELSLHLHTDAVRQS